MSKPAGADREGAVILPSIPAKRYFTIGEVSDLCAVKPHVLRYWEQEFTQLKPIKRRGNRRYYQHHEVLLIRRIRDLLYEQGFTINGARNKLDGASIGNAARRRSGRSSLADVDVPGADGTAMNFAPHDELLPNGLQEELLAIRALLASAPPVEPAKDG
jgi:DNA-binding transcriptional MerR regulator